MIQEDDEATRMLWFVHIILFLLLVVADGHTDREDLGLSVCVKQEERL